MIALLIIPLVLVWLATVVFGTRWLLNEWRMEHYYSSPYGRHPTRELTWGHIIAALSLAAVGGWGIAGVLALTRMVKFVQAQTNTAEKFAAVLGVRERGEKPKKKSYY